jgi:hypothetical protein
MILEARIVKATRGQAARTGGYVLAVRDLADARPQAPDMRRWTMRTADQVRAERLLNAAGYNIAPGGWVTREGDGAMFAEVTR